MNSSLPRADIALARRLERAEACANAATVEARRAVQPQVGAEWIDVAGAYAMFDGPDSPITQTFGLGLFEPFAENEFEQVEDFFTTRGAATAHEVSSFAAQSTLGLLSARGYTPIEASTVLIRQATTIDGPSGPIAVRVTDVGEAPLWSRIAAQGWGADAPELIAFLEDLGAVIARTSGVTCFLAELNGEPIATAALNVANGVALLAGAGTIPTARRQGAQLALLRARLEFAESRGIDLAMVVTSPGSASQRNSERQGFRPAYTRAKWNRPIGRGGRR